MTEIIKKISVIIPVYNCEPFLKKCLESVIGQDYPNIEIILVDDGSKDNSGRICDEYAQKYDYIKVIHQQNEGVSAARNKALKQMEGEYLCFLDSDDEFEENALNIKIDKIGNADLLISSIREIDEVGNSIRVQEVPDNIKLSNEEMLWYLFDEEKYGYQGYITNKMFKASIIKKNKICFDCSIKYNEDRLFLVEYLLKAKIVKFNSDISYLYRQHSSSAMGKLKQEFDIGMLTELDAFEKMKTLIWKKNQNLYYCISRLTFEKSLYWIRKIEDNNKQKKHVRKVLWKNAITCLKERKRGLTYKLKIIGHCIIEY